MKDKVNVWSIGTVNTNIICMPLLLHDFFQFFSMLIKKFDPMLIGL